MYKLKTILSNSKERTSLPRKWSSQDHYFYRQCIRKACCIGEIRSSLANKIAKIVRDTSIHTESDWKEIARCLGLDNESQLKDVEEAAGCKQELPLYIVLTSQYMKNPAASLGELLNILMNLKRHDILIKIKEDVREIIDEYDGQRTAPFPSISQQNIKNQPIEEEESMKPAHQNQNVFQNRDMEDGKLGTKCLPRNYHSDDVHMYPKKKGGHGLAFYGQDSPPCSLLEIPNKSDEAMKNSNDSVDCSHPSHEKDNIAFMSNWKTKTRENGDFGTNKKLITKSDVNGITDFEFINPADKNQSLRSNINETTELNSGDYTLCHEEVTDNGINIEANSSSAYVDTSILTYTESERSNDKYFDADTEEYIDSDSSYDKDLDSLCESFNTTNSRQQNIESSALSRDCDNRRIENENFQQLNIREYGKTEQCDDQSGRKYDEDNTVNERIEDLVAEKDESVRNVERAEREPVGFLALQTSKTMKKPQDCLLTFVSTVLRDSSINLDRSIKVIVIHSQEDSDTAIDLAHALVKLFHMAAVAECELNAFWIMDHGHYRAALYWADIIIPLITNTWLEDITNEKSLLEREVPSLNARSVFRLLQNMFSNSGSVNLSVIPVVLEGTSRRFISHPEIRNAIKLSRDFHTDKGMKYLGDLIKNFHSITRDAKKQLLDYI